MKKIKLLFFAAIMFAFTSTAQDKKITFDIGPVAGVPVGYITKVSNAVFGAELTATLRVKNHFKIFSQTGYYYFMGKPFYSSDGRSVDFKWGNTAHFPFYIGPKLDYEKFFIGIGVGYVKYDLLSRLGYNPQIGYKSGKLYFVANYSTSTSFGYLRNYSAGTSIGNLKFSFIGLKCSYNF